MPVLTGDYWKRGLPIPNSQPFFSKVVCFIYLIYVLFISYMCVCEFLKTLTQAAPQNHYCVTSPPTLGRRVGGSSLPASPGGYLMEQGKSRGKKPSQTTLEFAEYVTASLNLFDFMIPSCPSPRNSQWCFFFLISKFLKIIFEKFRLTP